MNLERRNENSADYYLDKRISSRLWGSFCRVANYISIGQPRKNCYNSEISITDAETVRISQ